MSGTDTMVIIGAGLGGVSAAGALRQDGFTGRIVLINNEKELPYDRPPLSKSVLQGVETLTDVYLKAPNWYDDNNVELLSGVAATQIKPDQHQVVLDNGTTLEYSKLLIATGAQARRIPALEQGGVPYFYLRTDLDALGLKEQLGPGKKLVLIGAGVIGLETAASATKLGCEVAVVEIAERVMARFMSEDMSAWVQAKHEAQGVRFYLKDSVAGFSDDSKGLVLASGATLEADVILIGAGVVPVAELAEACGLECNNGIVVNEYCQTSSPDIYAIGDVAFYPDAWMGRPMRSENWLHAQKQGECAARNMNGGNEAYGDIQSVWSDQYDFKLQTSGVLEGDQVVLRGDMSADNFMIFYLQDGVVRGVLGVNSAKFMRLAQNMIKAKAPVDVAVLADPAANLKKAMP
ncbi:MAG: FAD-dependent oxidoreductase [Porticoccaceae bacterium]